MAEPIDARLVRPPLQAHLVRPPRRRGLVGPAVAEATRLPLPWAVLAAARLLRAAASAAPAVVLIGLFRRAWAQSADPFETVARVIAAPALLLPGVGLAAALVALAALVEVLGWTLALPRIAGREDARPFAQRFAALVQTAALLVVVAAAGALALVPLVILAARTQLEAYGAGGVAGPVAAGALALVLTLALAAALLFRLGAEAAIVRVGGFGDRPLAGIYEGARLVLRRPLVLLAAFYLLGLAAALVTSALAVPAALAPPGGAAFAMTVLVEIATAGAVGLLSLARLGVFAAAART